MIKRHPPYRPWLFRP